jgi:hypothetical protein
MKKSIISEQLLNQFGASGFEEVETIQTLWSGYGKITRFKLVGSDIGSVVVKNIILPNSQNHPKGWNTKNSHLRKIKSYQVEVEWYKNWALHGYNFSRIPQCYKSISKESEHIIILEDMDESGYPVRKSSLSVLEAKVGLNWLANFHATFMNKKPSKLWKVGTYWHLATRPDEYNRMEEGEIKRNAPKIDQLLNDCKYKTIVHGDAKVANFCFSKEMNKVAAVDFQYVGGGCGMKDVAYFLGSCLSEKECDLFEEELLQYYFSELEIALIKNGKSKDITELRNEWRSLYPLAWADFTRFLLGWMPSHEKINSYSLRMIERALRIIKN